MGRRDRADVRIRTMTADEVGYAVDRAAAEGWNPGVDDARLFWFADPHGFFAATIEDELVGCISAVMYGSGFGFVGLYIVEPTMRGQRIGTALWTAAMDRVGGRVVGLDGVVAMQHAYHESGFTLAHRNIRYAGDIDRDRAVHPSVAPFTDADFGEVAIYDEPCFGAPRLDFLSDWLRQPHGFARVLRRHGAVSGFAVARQCREGYKIGPLFADDETAALALFDSMVHDVPVGMTVILDVPEPNDVARGIAEDAGMAPVFETARMYVNGEASLPLERVFGITSFELG
jgi:GNAT superfamily N-acetyltransferase